MPEPTVPSRSGTLTTRHGWSNFVDDTPTPPDLLPEPQWHELDNTDREDYDEARIRHHARLVTVATPLVSDITRTGRRLTLLNRDQTSARRGLIASGEPGTGKTTAITQLGKHHEITARRRRGDVPGPFLPVVYVTVPPAATPKMLAGEFARFLSLPIRRYSNQAQITNSVCDLLNRAGTDLVLVDEIHNIAFHTRNCAEASDQLKYLAERINATFVYAGIDVEAQGLFTGIRGRQIAGRFSAITTRPFGNTTTVERDHWRALVATLEQALRLHRLAPGHLLRHADLLHDRTGGMIGSLSHLIRDAAVDAILSGSETITKTALTAIRLDHAAEDRSARSRRRSPTAS